MFDDTVVKTIDISVLSVAAGHRRCLSEARIDQHDREGAVEPFNSFSGNDPAQVRWHHPGPAGDDIANSASPRVVGGN